jgi:small subunit ribosomal protein S25e
VPKKQRLITIYNLIENYKINGSLARKGIRELVKRNLLQPVAPSGTYGVWTKSAAVEKAEAAAKAAKGAESKDAGKGAKPAKPQAKKTDKAAAKAEQEAAAAADE